MKVTISAVALLSAALYAPAVHAHGTMAIPKPNFVQAQSDQTAPCALIDGPNALPSLPGQSYTGGPEDNTAAFTAALKASSYSSLKDFVMAKMTPEQNAEKECGFTRLTGEKQPVPSQVEWSHGENEGFTPSHNGPCEVWCDNERVFQDDNCAKNYPQAPARLPIDSGKCQGKSVLKIVWLALHSPQWQVYINCAQLQGGGDVAPTPTGAPTVQPNPYLPTPAPDTVAPTPKPSSNCRIKRRRRQHRRLRTDEVAL